MSRQWCDGTDRCNTCDLCKKRLKEYMFDAELLMQGVWMILCSECFILNATPTVGQVYRRNKAQHSWDKVCDVRHLFHINLQFRTTLIDIVKEARGAERKM